MTDAARAKDDDAVKILVAMWNDEAGEGESLPGWRLADLERGINALLATQTADKDAEIARLTALVVQTRDDAKAAQADADTFSEALEMTRTQTAALRARRK